MVVFSVNQPLETETIELKAVWETIDSQSCPYRYNFHLHTHCSDGQMSPSNLVEQALEVGLKGFAITDHHSVEGYRQAQEKLETLEVPKPRLWTGVEITAELLHTEVHILGYGFDIDSPKIKPYLQGTRVKDEKFLASNVIRNIHRANGLAVLAHPYRYHRPALALIAAAHEAGIDGIEAFYAYGNPKPWQPSPRETEEATRIAAERGLFTTCGTDSHGLSLLRRI